MARLRLILIRCWAARTARFCLLAGSILISSFPSAASVRAAFLDAVRAASAGHEPLHDDRELPEDEPCSGDLGLPAAARRQPSGLSPTEGFGAPGFFWPWAVLSRALTRPCCLTRFDSGVDRTGHFLTEGWMLRLWVQSQTC